MNKNQNRILCIDYGDRRVGLALSDPGRMLATGVLTIEKHDINELILEIKKLANKYEISEILLGIPINMNGTEGEMAIKTREFGSLLKSALDIDLIFWDERLSTKLALRYCREQSISMKKSKKKLDQLAAEIILQEYLDFLKNQELKNR